MKNLIKTTLSVAFLMTALPLQAASKKKSVATDFDLLGGSQAIVNRARALNPSNKVRIVQKRIVDRSIRLEAGGMYAPTFGGREFVDTTGSGGILEFHITPKFSLGARYTKFSNTLTTEGEKQLALAEGGNATVSTPQFDFAEESLLGTISWYPTYGKINLFNAAVVQFDLYVLGGAGTTRLSKSGDSFTVTAGGGVGFWLSQHISLRFEGRYATYKDQPFIGGEKENVNNTSAAAILGVLF